MRKKLRLAIVFLLIIAVSAGCGATGPGSAVMQKNNTAVKAEVDEKSAAAVFDLAKEDPEKGAEALNDIEDKATYEETLRDILDHYYKKDAEKDIETFTAKTDKRSKIIINNYQESADERENAKNLEYDVDEILVVFESSVSDNTIESTVEDERGELQSVSKIADDRKLATIEKSLEYTVAKAGAGFSSKPGVVYAQPNYKYSIADEENTEGYTEALEEPKEDPIEKQTTDETNSLDLNKQYLQTEDTVLEKSTEKDITPSSTPTDPRYAEQWHIRNISADDAWDSLNLLETRSTGIKVAVIDTGVDANHEDLVGVINTTDSGFVEGNEVITGVTDSDGHGTHVCGIIAAEYGPGTDEYPVGGVGVASVSASNDTVDIIAIDAYDEVEEAFFSNDIAVAIYYARQKDAQLINMSLTGPGEDLTVELQIEAAYYNNNILCICAAGNEHTDAMRSPSDVEETISVMASYGTTTAGSGSIDHRYSNYGYEKDILAPGTGIWSTILYEDGRYASWSGTSMAAPVVTAVAAMVLSANSSLAPREIKNILYSTAGDSFGIYTGYGKIDAKEAVDAATSLSPDSEASEILLNRSTMKLAVGTERSLEYKIEPASAANTSVTWSSNNNTIATVNRTTGEITGISPGIATITATADGVSDSCTVNVFGDYPNSILINTSKTGRFTEETRVDSYVFNYNSDNEWSADWNVDGYYFRGTAGKKIRITMETLTNNSNDADYNVDPWLILYKPNKGLLAYDDPNISGSKSEITAILPETGTYYIDAAQTGNENGTYSIKIDDITYPAPGTKLTDGILIYKVMSGNTLSVTGVKSKKIKYAKIPSYARINGKKYYITSIGKNTFKKCRRLTKISIGSNIKSIGAYSFYGCKKLKRITVNGKKIKKVAKKALKGIHKYAKIRVPKTKLKAYKKIFRNKGQRRTVKIVKK